MQAALAHSVRREAGTPGSIWVYGHGSDGRIVKVCVSAHDDSFVITAARP